MGYLFDGPNKLITLTAGTTSFNVADLFSRWKDWVIEFDNTKYLPAFDLSVGGDDLGDGIYAGAYFFITNGWQIKPQEANHKLTIEGNLFSIPSSAQIFRATSGSYNVLIQMKTSSLTQLIDSGGTGVWSESEKNEALSKITDIKKILANNSKIINNQLIIYEDDGTTVFLTFDLKNAGGNPATEEVREINNA